MNEIRSDTLAGMATVTLNFTEGSCALIAIGRNNYGSALIFVEQWGGKFLVFSSGNAGNVYLDAITVSSHTVTITNPYNSYIPFLFLAK